MMAKKNIPDAICKHWKAMASGWLGLCMKKEGHPEKPIECTCEDYEADNDTDYIKDSMEDK